ncbi:PDZ domain-containing protein [Candidatus Poribacteria bacterium]|nr:PDZ domain-containing protein [Candidatus Poribacteria bacterium]
MIRHLVVFLSLLLLVAGALYAAEDRKTKVLNDRERFESEGFWIYNDLPKGIEESKKTGKPLLVVFRCIPCEACAGFDERVANRDPQVNDLLEKFVCVRIVKANGMDLSLLQFDYDLSFAAFFMNPDKTIYGRFGSRSERKDPERDISIEGFRKALAAALEVHKAYPANKALFVGKQAKPVEIQAPENYPSLRGKYTSTLDYEGKVVASCIHCHQIRDAERLMLRSDHKPIPENVLYPWPMPDVVGLSLSPSEKATVTSVAPDSAAEKAGFLPGDELVTLEGQMMLSIADVQWVLHNADAPATLKAEVLRNGQTVNLTLALREDWRRSSDITWRVTTWDLRRMGTGGLVLEDVPSGDRHKANLTDTQLALRVTGMGQYSPHDAAKQAGFKQGDIIVDFDGQTRFMTPSQLVGYAVQNRVPGEQVIVTVLREGERVNLELPMQ